MFSGTIKGNGHVVRNLTVAGSTNLGLIGVMGLFAQVYGLGIVDATSPRILDDLRSSCSLMPARPFPGQSLNLIFMCMPFMPKRWLLLTFPLPSQRIG